MIQEDYVRKAEVLKITDGDTIVCRIDMGYHIFVTQPLRLNRINAPELNTVAGKAARNYLVTHLELATGVLIKTHKNPADKYGRWLADVYKDGKCINDQLVADGHAVYKDY